MWKCPKKRSSPCLGLMKNNGLAIYVHIPFCLAKCSYCDFNSYPKSHPCFQEYHNYLEALLLEIQRAPQSHRVISVFFGGGTPTLLPAKAIIGILDKIRNHYSLTTDCEISIEANPDTITEEQLGELRSAGFNRLSLGIQSLNNRFLILLGRTYDEEGAHRGIAKALKAGFPQVSLDLIHGLPGQGLEDWVTTLDQVRNLPIDHLSCYGLQVEKGTPLAHKVENGQLVLPDEGTQVDMLLTTRDILAKSGFDHYEISNYAKQEKECRHNLQYWYNQEYLGFGAGAHSFWSGFRRANLANPLEYVEKILGGQPVVAERQQVRIHDEMDETAFLGLRLIKGIDLVEFQARFDRDFRQVYSQAVTELAQWGLLKETPTHIRLTRAGLPLANQVFSRFIRIS
jgi:oxygen-independent coproporphyrinogen-3 oxidase